MIPILTLLLPYLPAAITLLVTFAAAILVGRLAGGLFGSGNPRVAGAGRRFSALLVWAVGLTLAIQELGVSPDVILLVLALLGVTALIALREPLEHAGAKYFSDVYTPFKVGDTIQVAGHAGKVIEINPMSTVLLTADEQLVSVPNATLLNDVVVNTSPQAWKELTIPISIGTNVDLPAFESEVLRTISKLRLRLDQRFPPVLTTKSRSAQGSEVILTLMLRTPEDREAVTAEVNKRLAEVMARSHPARR